MKNVILLLILILSIQITAAQPTRRSINIEIPDDERIEQYLTKSKQLKTAGWILLSTGMACNIAAMVNYPIGYNLLFGSSSDSDDRKFRTSVALFVAGTSGVSVGIPILVKGYSYQKKAMKLSFKNEQWVILKNSNLFYKTVPSLSLAIDL